MSGVSWKQTVKWDKAKGCGVMSKEESPKSLDLLRYYRSQRVLGSGSSYPESQECKTTKQLASACDQGTLWPLDTWTDEAVIREEKHFWDTVDDPTVSRHYEQERNCKSRKSWCRQREKR